MKINKNLAEIIGIMLGDGCIYVNRIRGIYQIRIAGHSKNDKDYLISYVKPLFEKAFDIKVGIKLHPSRKELFLCVDRKDVVFKFKKLGLQPGNKKKNNIGIPKWIFKNRAFLKACLRGLIDTDGSVYPKTPNHPCASICFTSAIPKLRNDITRVFKLLGFHPSKWISKRDHTSQDTVIGKSNEAIRYLKEIGFKNKYHEKRFFKFLRAPIV